MKLFSNTYYFAFCNIFSISRDGENEGKFRPANPVRTENKLD